MLSIDDSVTASQACPQVLPGVFLEPWVKVAEYAAITVGSTGQIFILVKTP